MKHFLILLFFLPISLLAQQAGYTCEGSGAPTFTPTAFGCKSYVDTIAGRMYAWNGSAWVADAVRMLTGSDATTDARAAIYGVAPVYTSGGIPRAASTTDANTLHQYYATPASGGYIVLGAGTRRISATFNYVVGQTYYLNDAGELQTTADADYVSQVLSVIASLGNNEYLVNLAQPIHFNF